MRAKISYEWTIETVEDGNIVESDFSESLNFESIEGKDLGLIRYEGNEVDGIISTLWAYVKNGELPKCFSDAMGTAVDVAVPSRFNKELFQFLK